MAQTAEIYSLDAPRNEWGNWQTADIGTPEGSSFDLFALLWRKKLLMLGSIIAVTLFSVLAAYQITPKYSATVRLMIGGAKSPTAGALSQVLSGRDGLRSQIYGELEIMQSDKLLDMAVVQLDLLNDPEFNRSLLVRWGERLSEYSLLKPVVDLFRDTGGAAEESEVAKKQIALNILRTNLEVHPPSLSNVISVTVNSVDPRKAAKLANTFVDLYIADNVDRRIRASAETRAWLDNRINELRESVLSSERAVAEFLTSRRLVESGRNAVVERQFAALTSQLATAKADYAEKQTRMAQVYRLRNSAQGIGAAKEVRVSPLIQRLQDQEAIVQRKIAELEPNFGERHPQMVNLRAELTAARQRIGEEQARIVQELENEVRVSRSRVTAISEELNKLDAKRIESGQDMVRLRQLKRESEANQRLYEMYLVRLKQSDNHRDVMGENNVQIVSAARAPVLPSYPRKGLIIGLGFLSSLGLGLFLIFLSERLDNGFSSTDQLENMTGMPVLGPVPRLSAAEKDGRAPAEMVLSSPDSAYGEAIRSIRTGLSVSNMDSSPKTVLIASSLPGEGKTSLAVSLARQSAVSSVRGNVVLVDCDLRRPSVSSVLGLRAEVGLTELFAGEASLEEVLKIDPKSGLHVVPSTAGTPNPPELLNSQHMRDLLVQLSNSYDLVILDSPALDAVADARVLTHLVDAIVFVVQSGATPRKMVLSTLKLLVSARARIAGLVLHRTAEKREERYVYSERSSALQ
jgi:capsular exopolysaccharide synthesis family protein